MFNHLYICVEKCNRESINGKRHYVTPSGGKYPSITTVLSALSEDSIKEWRESVGEEVADKISSYAAFRGTNVHTLCEKYLNNEQVTPKTCSYHAYESFVSIKPELNKINNVHCQETALYSDKLKIAGSVDCIAEYNNTLSVIDFKTSRKLKKEEYIHSYFLQATFYALAYEELTGLKIPQIVILIAVDDEQPQVFIKNPHDYILPLVKAKRLYDRKNA